MTILFFAVLLALQTDSIIECPERELWAGDSGSWIPEDHITEDNAKKALVHLEKYVAGEITEISASGWELDATIKILEGYVLKQLSETEILGKTPGESSERNRYCLWLERRGFYLGAAQIGVLQNNSPLQLTSFAGS